MTSTTRHSLYHAWDQCETVCAITGGAQFVLVTAYLVTKNADIPLWLTLGALPQLLASLDLRQRDNVLLTLPITDRERGLFMWLRDGGMAAMTLVLSTLVASVIPFLMVRTHFNTHYLIAAVAYPIGFIGLSQWASVYLPRRSRAGRTDSAGLALILLLISLAVAWGVFDFHFTSSYGIAHSIVALGVLGFSALGVRSTWYAKQRLTPRRMSGFSVRAWQQTTTSLRANLPWTIALLGWRLPLGLALGAAIALSNQVSSSLVTQHWAIAIMMSLLRIDRSQLLNARVRALRALPMSARALAAKILMLNTLPIIAFLFACTSTCAVTARPVSIEFAEYVVLLMAFIGAVHGAEFLLRGDKGSWWKLTLLMVIGVALIYLSYRLDGIARHATIVSLLIGFYSVGYYWLLQAIRRGGYNFLRKKNVATV